MLYKIRWSILWVWFAFSTSALSLVLLFRQGNPRNGVFINHIIGRVALKILGIRVEIENPEALENFEPCVFIANHQNLLDVFTYASHFPEKTFVIAKKSLKYVPFFGWAFSLSGNIYIDRRDKEKAIKKLTSAEEAIKNGWSFFVFPEGTRSRGKELGAFKKGAFHVALNTNVPITPFISEKHKISFNSFKVSTVKMKILESTYLNKNEDLDKQINKIRQQVLNYLGQ